MNRTVFHRAMAGALADPRVTPETLPDAIAAIEQFADEFDAPAYTDAEVEEAEARYLEACATFRLTYMDIGTAPN
jgi:hypothetical protein